MERLNVLLTGATGTMGKSTLDLLLKENLVKVTVFSLDSKKDRKILKTYQENNQVSIIWGDLRDYNDVLTAIKDIDIILHLAALVSPLADAYPELAMEINFGGTLNLIQAIEKEKRQNDIYFVYIGTVAQTGDRMPPIHWGRVGDPIKPSIYDYYAVSKVAAERIVIESKIKNWVSLRQTGIMGQNMTKILDPIILHNPLNNVLEYVSDRDSGILLKNLVLQIAEKKLNPDFWGHIYNIGGGSSCRINSLELYANSFAKLGIDNMQDLFKANWFATRNFHGQYYLDSDKLENYLHFRNDDINYFYESFEKSYGFKAKLGRFLSKLPILQTIMKSVIHRSFKKLALHKSGTLKALNDMNQAAINAFWSSLDKWEEIPPKINDFQAFKAWDEVIHINHGYDERKAKSELSLEDLQKAAEFRGGSCLSQKMNIGAWKDKLAFKCAFGHEFKASPRLVLEGGHWCPVCEDKSWNYVERAKKDPFFAQVWYPLHSENKKNFEYEKIITSAKIEEKFLKKQK
ncbi:MAG TPA: NAD(P)-dependent oxidoreductase [Candidatus Eisenbacteria bacterium]|nr:NAD(P)-dependent oxidoreductase [Candidatus Eisenbacteria bacterium]